MAMFEKVIKIYPHIDTTLAIDAIKELVKYKPEYEKEFGQPLNHAIVVSCTLPDDDVVRRLVVYETETSYVVRANQDTP